MFIEGEEDWPAFPLVDPYDINGKIRGFKYTRLFIPLGTGLDFFSWFQFSLRT
jgi:hypothetical protein